MSKTYSFNRNKIPDENKQVSESFDMSETSFPALSSLKSPLKDLSSKSMCWTDNTKLNIIKEPPTIQQIIPKKKENINLFSTVKRKHVEEYDDEYQDEYADEEYY